MTEMYTNDQNRKRSKQLKLWYTQGEYDLIRDGAKAAGVPMNAYVLRAVQLLQEQEQQAQDNQQAIK